MRLPWRRRPAPAPHSNPVTIAVMEAEELDIQPEPGTAAAAVVALRAAFGPRWSSPQSGGEIAAPPAVVNGAAS